MRTLLNSEEQLVKGLQKGDAAAYKEFLSVYGPRIFNLHCWLCGNQTTAEDLTQETVLAVYRGIGKFKGQSRLTTWVHQVARNLALNHLKHKGNRNIPLEDIEEMESLENVDESAEKELLRGRVREALSMIPEAQRESVTLHCLNGMSHSEVANVLERPLGTVKWQIAQGLNAMKDALVRVGVDPNEL